MSHHERYGERDLAYSRWHRRDRIARYVSLEVAASLTMIDLDAIEVCARCYEPLMLIELAKDVGQSFKQTAIMVELAKRAQVPAVCVFWRPDGSGDIAQFRVRSVWPRGDERRLTPAEYARWLASLRENHGCAERRAA